MNRPTRMFRARSMMMLAVLDWFARVSERVAARWHRRRSTVGRLREAGTPPTARPADVRALARSVATKRRVVVRWAALLIARRRGHAGRFN